MTSMTYELTSRQFAEICRLVHGFCGIKLKGGKEALVRARLMKRLRALRLGSFEAYFDYLKSDRGSNELKQMIDVMTTNKTSFFREREHFRFLKESILPNLNGSRLRFWTAACSSGEEPFSLAMLLLESLTDCARRDVRILATDISMRMLEKASQGLYPQTTLQDLPTTYVNRYFERPASADKELLRVKPNVRSLVRLACLNLLDDWPMKGPFDVIFCRNVMIYFDRPTQQKLINRFYDLLDPGGYLFVGHSEGLSAISHKFRYVRPATYLK
jgi:chemotaxis protein methyltransferase CheR